MIINEETREKLGLGLWVEEAGESALAGGVKVPGGITEWVAIHWKDRRAAFEAVVLPDEEDILLGALPLEAMDLMVHPKTQEVVGAHGDKVRIVIKAHRPF